MMWIETLYDISVRVSAQLVVGYFNDRNARARYEQQLEDRMLQEHERHVHKLRVDRLLAQKDENKELMTIFARIKNGDASVLDLYLSSDSAQQGSWDRNDDLESINQGEEHL